MNPNDNNNKNGIPSANGIGFFIGEDGKLSATIDNKETEILGFHQSPFGGGWIVKDK